jgi:hypothetical protein
MPKFLSSVYELIYISYLIHLKYLPKIKNSYNTTSNETSLNVYLIYLFKKISNIIMRIRNKRQNKEKSLQYLNKRIKNDIPINNIFTTTNLARQHITTSYHISGLVTFNRNSLTKVRKNKPTS